MTKIISLIVILLGSASVAHAAGRGVVMKVDGGDIYVDLGNQEGVGVGAELRLLHVITATHPVSKKKVRDTFYLGKLIVVSAGKHTCLAHTSAELLPRVTPGDEIDFGAAEPLADAWEEATLPKPAPGDEADQTPQVDPKKLEAERAAKLAAAQDAVLTAQAAREAWHASLGKPPADRIAIWNDYLAKNPKSPYAQTVRGEIASLEALKRDDDERARAAAEAEGPGTLAQLATASGGLQGIQLSGPLAYVPPTRVYEGASFELAYLVVKPGAVTEAWVHYRGPGATTFARAALTLTGDGYLRARIPAGTVRAPRLEYFVEVIGPGASTPAAIVGTAEEPATIAVDATVETPRPDRAHRSRVSLFLDYVDFDAVDPHDQYTQFEADFMYRFRGPVWSLRLGVASLAGRGGPTAVIDADTMHQCHDAGGIDRCKRVSYDYVYTELELRLHDLFSIMLRPMYGGGFVTSQPAGMSIPVEDFGGAFGFRARVRIGREQETNLVLGVGHIGFGSEKKFGTLIEAAFTWDVIKQFPVVLSTQVSDQPVPDDYGLRLIADVGWRRWKWIYPSVRIAVQGRNINHQGVSGGLALNFDW